MISGGNRPIQNFSELIVSGVRSLACPSSVRSPTEGERESFRGDEKLHSCASPSPKCRMQQSCDDSMQELEEERKSARREREVR